MEANPENKVVHPRPHRQASKRQLTALKLVADGMPPGKAMLSAGYSKWAARNPKQVLLQSHAITNAVDEMRIELTRIGITVPYIATKLKAWLDSGDERVAQASYDRIAPLLNLVGPDNKGLKRKVTLEEWLEPAATIQDSDSDPATEPPAKL